MLVLTVIRALSPPLRDRDRIFGHFRWRNHLYKRRCVGDRLFRLERPQKKIKNLDSS